MFVDNIEIGLPLSTGVCESDNLPSLFAHVKVLHVNARSLHSCGKFAELTNLVCCSDADVVCVSETFFSPCDVNLFHLDDYAHFAIARNSRHGGGVSLFIRKSFIVLDHTSFSTDDEAVQAIRCSVKRRDVVCSIIGFYSNNRSQYDELLKILDKATTGISHFMILAGDSNINTLVHDYISTEYLSFLAARGLLPAINGVTRIDSNTCLDHIFVSIGAPLAEVNSRIIESNALSDHFPVWCALCFNIVPTSVDSQPVSARRRIFSSRNFAKFFNTLSVTDFSPVYSPSDTTCAFAIFEELLFKVYDNCFPTRVFRFAKQRSDPLFHNELRRMRRRLDRLLRAYVRNKSDVIAKQNYYAYLSQYRKYRRVVITSYVNIADGSLGKTWRFIN